MLLVLHIVAALGGIVMSSYAVLSPSIRKIRLSGGLVFLTVASGTAIIIERHLGLVSACVSGLLYVGFTASALVAAARRLAKENA
jgi:hypothetical protein